MVQPPELGAVPGGLRGARTGARRRLLNPGSPGRLAPVCYAARRGGVMDEAAVRAALTTVLDPAEIAEVTVEPGRIGVLLSSEPATTAELERVHTHLSAAFPDTTVEVCAG